MGKWDSFELKQLEKSRVSRFVQKVRRSNGLLELLLSNGVMQLQNKRESQSDAMDWEDFYFLCFYPKNDFFLILWMMEETHEFMLINQFGEKTILDNLPIFSPNFERFCVIVPAEKARDVDYELGIFKIQNGKPICEYKIPRGLFGRKLLKTGYSVKQWPEEAIWVNDDYISLRAKINNYGKRSKNFNEYGKLLFNCLESKWEQE